MRLAWIDACSWPGGVVRGFLSARVFLSFILGLLLFLVRGTCACTSVAPKREAGGFFHLVSYASCPVHSLDLVDLHRPLKVLDAAAITVRLLKTSIPALLALNSCFETGERTLHVFQTVTRAVSVH